MVLAAFSYRYLAIFWRKRYYFIIPILLLPLAGFFIGQSIPIKYTAKTTILLQESALINPTLADISLQYNLRARFKALKLLLQSRELLLSIIEKSGVAKHEDPMWLKLWYISQVKQNLVVYRAGSELVNMTMQWHDPKQLKQILALLSAAFTQRLTQPNLTSRASATDFLQTQIGRQETQLQYTETQLTDLQAQYLHKLPLLFSDRVQVYSDISTLLLDKQQALVRLNSQLATLNSALSNNNLAMQLAEKKLLKLQQQQLLLTSKYTDKHSRVKQMSQQIALLQQQLDKSSNAAMSNDAARANISQLSSLVNNLTHKSDTSLFPRTLVSQLQQQQALREKVALLRNQIATLSVQLSEYESKKSEYRRAEYVLTNLGENVQQQRKILIDLKLRHEMAKLSQALGQFESTDLVRTRQSVIMAEQNTLLSPYLYAFIGLCIALVQTMLLCVLMSFTQDKIWFKEDIALLTKIPIICSINCTKTVD